MMAEGGLPARPPRLNPRELRLDKPVFRRPLQAEPAVSCLEEPEVSAMIFVILIFVFCVCVWGGGGGGRGRAEVGSGSLYMSCIKRKPVFEFTTRSAGFKLAKKFREKFSLSPVKFGRSFYLNIRFAYIFYTYSLLPQLKIGRSLFI